MTEPAPPTLQDLQRQLDEMKGLLIQLQTIPDLASLVEKKDWKQALEVLPRIPSLTQSLLQDIITKDMSGEIPDPARVALWTAIILTPRFGVTPEQLHSLEHSNCKRTGLMNAVVYDTTENRDVIAWVVKMAEPRFLLAALNRRFGKHGQESADLVAWTVFSQNVLGLHNLFFIKTSDGRFVFPRTEASAWEWTTFSKEVRHPAARAGIQNLQDGKACVQFWFETVGPNF